MFLGMGNYAELLSGKLILTVHVLHVLGPGHWNVAPFQGENIITLNNHYPVLSPTQSSVLPSPQSFPVLSTTQSLVLPSPQSYPVLSPTQSSVLPCTQSYPVLSPTQSSVPPSPQSYPVLSPSQSSVLPSPQSYPVLSPTQSSVLPSPQSYPVLSPTLSSVLPSPQYYPVLSPTQSSTKMYLQMIISLSVLTFICSTPIIEKIPNKAKKSKDSTTGIISRPVRQVVEEVTEIQDTIVPDAAAIAPQGPVVQTITETQDFAVGPNGIQIPLQTSLSSQVSPFGMPQGFYRKREFPKKFQFFTPINSTTTTSHSVQVQPSAPVFINTTGTRQNASKAKVFLHRGHLTTTSTTAASTITGLLSLTPVPSTSLSSTQFPLSSTTDSSDLTTSHLVVTATSAFFPLPAENGTTASSIPATPTARPAVAKSITFTVKPKSKYMFWKEKKTAAKGSNVIPMSREIQEIYTIAERADNATNTNQTVNAVNQTVNAVNQTVNATDQTVNSTSQTVNAVNTKQTVISLNGAAPSVVAARSTTSTRSGPARLTTTPKRLLRDEEPPVTQHQLDRAAERALLLPAKNLPINATIPANRTVFAEFKPRDFFQ
ncbi:hypothetical protein BV898_10526 [Hypsibius exemplaris]|uniref:Uncharacterized protein n=1 Tax=Hypsibius exemplaris TaxID=2072580 RepID=A0A1W0WJA9_HYPEX|nr:hypothetical protein BV898_10526 [Hypsibius exemplaris]